MTAENKKTFYPSRCLILALLFSLGFCGCRSTLEVTPDYRTQPVTGGWSRSPQPLPAKKSAPSPAAPAKKITRPPKKESPTIIKEEPLNLDHWRSFEESLTQQEPRVPSRVPDRRWEGKVYFAYNQSVIGDTERGKLEKLATYLKENPRFSVIIEGHCDERGSEEYNRSLGSYRALEVKKYLEELGISEKRLQTISYGEERPADPGKTEAAYAKNRRAEFVIIDARNDSKKGLK